MLARGSASDRRHCRFARSRSEPHARDGRWRSCTCAERAGTSPPRRSGRWPERAGVIAAVAIPGRAVPHPRSQRFAPLGRPWAWLDWFGAAVARELGGVLADWCRPPSAWCSTATRTGRAPRTTPGAGPLDPDLRVLGGGARAAVEVRYWSPGGDTTFVLSLADVVRGRPSCRDRFRRGLARLLDTERNERNNMYEYP